jgi:hypothetical protein
MKQKDDLLLFRRLRFSELRVIGVARRYVRSFN